MGTHIFSEWPITHLYESASSTKRGMGWATLVGMVRWMIGSSWHLPSSTMWCWVEFCWGLTSKIRSFELIGKYALFG
jgi:hypothetical protein